MALTVEDGTIVAGADSYVTRSEFITYAYNRNITVDDDINTDEILRTAFDYIDSQEHKLHGERVYDVNASAFPRYNLSIDGYDYDSSTIPEQVKKCQMELAIDILNGIDLWNRKASDSTPIKSKMVGGAVQIHYAVQNGQPALRKSRSRSLLSKLKRGGGFSLGLARG